MRGSRQHILGAGNEVACGKVAWNAGLVRFVDPHAAVLAQGDAAVDDDAVHRSLGLMSTPHIVGKRAGGMQHIDLPVRTVERTMWILIHPDLRGTARVKALMNHLLVNLQKEKADFVR